MVLRLTKRIPEDFELGVSASAWQIEGASDSRERSIWDSFAESPGRIRDGSLADPACDHVNRLTEDLNLLSWLGVDSYSFTISWPRARWRFNGQRGSDFYQRLVDGLLERHIKPVATLYHWDLPEVFEADGGWLNRGTTDAFAQYAVDAFELLGDRVTRWATLNEPWCPAFLGYGAGIHAPGVSDSASALKAAHHLMLAHGKAIEALRQLGEAELGIKLNLMPVLPEHEIFKPVAEQIDGIQNRLFLDLLANRGVPPEVIENTASVTDWAFIGTEDLGLIGSRIDFLGIDYYTPMRVEVTSNDTASDPLGQAASAFPGATFVAKSTMGASAKVKFVAHEPKTEMGWEVNAPCLTEVLVRTSDAMPDVWLSINESGAAFADQRRRLDHIDDQDRINYLRDHLGATLAAVERGVDCRGYSVWSFLDNLEWAEGWTKKFGIIEVDPKDQTRTPKESAYWYREVCNSRRI